MLDTSTLSTLETRYPDLRGFASYWITSIAPLLGRLEAERKKALATFWLRLAIVFLGSCLLMYLVTTQWPDTFEVIVLVAMVGFLLGRIWAFGPLAQLRSQAKAHLVTSVCQFLKLAYNPSAASFPTERFMGIGLLPSHNRSSFEDQITGSVGGVSLELCEATLINRTRTSKGGSSNVTVFRGLLLKTPLPDKTVTGQILIRPDWGWVGNLFGGIGKPGELVPLVEDEAFERKYQVFSTTPDVARQKLNAILRQCLLRLAEINGKTPSVAMVGGDLLLALPRPADSFEGASAFQSFDQPRHAEGLIREIKLMAAIVEALRLPPSREAAPIG